MSRPKEKSSSFTDRFLHHLADHQSPKNLVYIGLGLVVLFIVSFSLTPQIGNKLGNLSVKKQGQYASADISERSKLVSLINQYRATNGLGQLAEDQYLTNAACWMAKDMATKNYFSHTDSTGRDPNQRLRDFGLKINTSNTVPPTNEAAGENLGKYLPTAQDTINYWKNSPDHNADMLLNTMSILGVAKPAIFSRIGIGVSYNQDGVYWVMDIATNWIQPINPLTSVSGNCSFPPPYTTIAGHVKNSAGNALSSVGIQIYNGSTNVTNSTVYTDTNGYWHLDNSVRTGQGYAVRVLGNLASPQTAPTGYSQPAKTTSSGWSWMGSCGSQYDVAVGSQSYECQQAGSNDCAGPNGSGTTARCDFAYTPSAPPLPPQATLNFVPSPCLTTTGTTCTSKVSWTITGYPSAFICYSNGTTQTLLGSGLTGTKTLTLPTGKKYTFSIKTPASSTCSSGTTIYTKDVLWQTRGDADCSGAIDSVDALAIQRYVAKLSFVTKCSGGAINQIAADVDGNGQIQTSDSTFVLQYASTAP